MIYYQPIQLKWGNAVVGIEETGSIIGLWFEHQKYFPKNLPEPLISIPTASADKSVRAAYDTFNRLSEQMKAYEDHRLTAFELPLNPTGTSFQRLIWTLLLNIPYGETTTYGQLSQEAAAALGRTHMSAQAVGQAVGHNPISLLIPCHRVVGAKGQLTGYAGGIDKKIALLQHEGSFY
ncbi:MAG: methylated-DNA-[protein]-cysteine S-methyltransferase [Clostridiales bacterium]|nr:methylated-DNA-[protein]-cysteine S-methyltransferase [Clostridiales bacterium]